MDRDYLWFFGSFFFGCFFSVQVMWKTHTYQTGEVAVKVINECQLTLPRNVKCKLVAVEDSINEVEGE